MSDVSIGRPDYARITLPPAPAERPYVLVNMVASVDGRAVLEGSERGLGSADDQRLMRELRSTAGMVLNGAGTLRASGTSSRVGDDDLVALRRARGRPDHPIAAVLSASGDLPLDRAFFTARDFDALVYLSVRAPQARADAIAATGRPVARLPDGDEPAALLRHARRERGVEVLLVEGGPTLNGALFALGAVDELFLTVSPLLVQGGDPRTIVQGRGPATREAVTRLEPLSIALHPATGELYLRYRVTGRGPLAR